MLNLLDPDTGLLVWQVFMAAIVISWILSILIVVKASRTHDSRLLLVGAISFLFPLLITVPYFLFARKESRRIR